MRTELHDRTTVNVGDRGMSIIAQDLHAWYVADTMGSPRQHHHSGDDGGVRDRIDDHAFAHRHVPSWPGGKRRTSGKPLWQRITGGMETRKGPDSSDPFAVRWCTLLLLLSGRLLLGGCFLGGLLRGGLLRCFLCHCVKGFETNVSLSVTCYAIVTKNVPTIVC